MARKVVSVALHKKRKPFKKSSKMKKLKTLLKNALNYMKSDTYMFAALLSPHSYNLASSSASFVEGGISCEPMKEKNRRKLTENVKDYLTCDCYMYAPLATDSASDSASLLIGDECGEKADIGSVGDHIEPRIDETARQYDNTMISSSDFENDGISNPTKQIVVKHDLLHREAVKHVVHQNCRSSSVPGKVSSQKKSRKIVVA